VPKCALLIVNQKSRCGTSDLEAAIEKLKNRGTEVIECKIERPERIPELIRRHHNRIDCVIIGGGDGSINAAAPSLLETRLPLGILPMGTANDLARTLKIPIDLAEAGDVIATGLLHRIDLGSVNGHYFFNVANIGLGVYVTHHLSSELKQRWGVLSYAHSLIRAIKQFRPFHAEIICDGRRRTVRSIQIAVGNGRHYGGGMTIAEQASIDDHQFFLYSIEPLSLWELIKFAPAFRTGRFEERHPVDVEQGKFIEIITRKTMAITADGEFVTRTPARFELLPDAISVFVPQSYFDEKQEASYAA
jgi:diacylglycerol kinase (ATP)